MDDKWTRDGTVPPLCPIVQEVLSGLRRAPVRLRLCTPWQPPLSSHAPSLKLLDVCCTLGLTIDGALVASLAQQVGQRACVHSAGNASIRACEGSSGDRWCRHMHAGTGLARACAARSCIPTVLLCPS